MIARALLRVLAFGFAPRPVMSTRRIVAVVDLMRTGVLEPCAMTAPDPGRHRRYPRTRPLLIGERP